MFTTPSSSRSRESQPASTRFWLYLGSVAVGFALMAIEDRGAEEKRLDAPGITTPAASNELAVKHPQNKQAPEVSPLRSLSAEFGRHAATLSAK